MKRPYSCPCGTSSAAMAIATSRDSTVTPIETSAWSVAHGYRTYDEGTTWSFFPAILKSYNIPCIDTSDVTKAIAALKKDFMVITSAGAGIWTLHGHIILAYGLTNNDTKVLINDPNSEAPYREIANISNYKAECGHFWIIEEEWKTAEIKTIAIKHSEKGFVNLNSVNVNGENYVRLRDMEKIAPIEVGWDGTNPTVKLNYKS